MKISFYNERYKKDIEDYKMSKEQLEYSSHPKEIIKGNKYDYYILGFVDGDLTNFLALKEIDKKRSLAIKGLSTDMRNLRLGYGENFIKKVIKMIEKDMNSIDIVSLEVDINNRKAIELYEKIGFVMTKRIREGRKASLSYMYMDI